MKIETALVVIQRALAPGQCITLNNVDIQSKIPNTTPSPVINLSRPLREFLFLKKNRMGKKTKLMIPIPKTSMALAPGQCIIFKNEPKRSAPTDIAPLTIIDFFMA